MEERRIECGTCTHHRLGHGATGAACNAPGRAEGEQCLRGEKSCGYLGIKSHPDFSYSLWEPIDDDFDDVLALFEPLPEAPVVSDDADAFEAGMSKLITSEDFERTVAKWSDEVKEEHPEHPLFEQPVITDYMRGVIEGGFSPITGKMLKDIKSETKDDNDVVTHPGHYTHNKIECWDWYELAMTDEEFRGAMKNNIWKYTFRYLHKNGIEDLKKAEFYLQRLIKFEAGERTVHMKGKKA